MNQMKHLLFLLPFSICMSCLGVGIEWQETGFTAKTPIKPGVPAFDGASVDYKRDGKTILKVNIGEPVVVAVADKPEKWGFFQFPGIRTNKDGSLLVATWSMAQDSVKSYGKGGTSGVAVSNDGGKTWKPRSGENIAGDGGLLLPNGDRIQVSTPKALEVAKLKLPAPLDSRKENYGRQCALYKMSELPEQLQGVYLSRMAKGTDSWRVEHAVLNDPKAVRYTDNDWFPIVWWGDMRVAADGSIIAGMYPDFHMDENNKVAPSGVGFYRSTDQGRTWDVRGRIPYVFDPAVDPNGSKRLVFGFTEPAFEILSSGVWLCILRTTDGLANSPMYRSSSEDMGVTWTKPVAFTPFGVLPKLLELDNGVLVLASGRPGMQLRFSTDGKGEQWTDPFDILPFKDTKDVVSCGYPRLLARGRDKFLLVYSDFKHINKDGEVRKAIKVREVSVTRE
jgi:hypothetical protein